MDYRFYDRDLDFLDKMEINFTVNDLKRRFGIELKTQDPHTNKKELEPQGDAVSIENVEEPDVCKHKIDKPEYDIYDSSIANAQLAEFKRASITQEQGDSNIEGNISQDIQQDKN